MTTSERAKSKHVDFGTGEGYLFLPDSAEPTGAVIILHERYGLVQHTLDLAAKLALDGYVVLAPDLFSRWEGDREALMRGDVRVTLPDPDVGRTINDCVTYLRQHPRVRPDRIAVMGVCQSGRYSMVVGHNPDVAALVVFYGAGQPSDWEVTDLQPVPMFEMIGRRAAPSLWIFGEADHVISIDDIQRVRAALENGRKSYRVKVFADMPHGWLNDTMPGRYRPAQAEQAWLILLRFLKDVFEGGWPPPDRVVWEFQSDTSVDYDFSKNVRLE